MMKKRLLIIGVWVAVIILIASTLFNVYLTLNQRSELMQEIQKAVSSQIKQIDVPTPKDGKDARTPVKNIDYFDGVNGSNATDEQVKKAVSDYFTANPPKVTTGKDGYTPIKGKDYVDGKDGGVPEIRCNVIKNRWETRFGEDQVWQLLNGEKVKCTTEEK